MPPPTSSSPAPVAVPPGIVKIAGPILIADILAWGLYGVLAVQVYIYFLAFPRDRSASRWLVAVVFLLETAQVIVIARDMFEAFARGFGHPGAITALGLSGFSAPIIAGTVGFLVQLFYAYRIKVLSESKIVPILICLMALIQCVGAFISGIRGFIGKDVRNLNTITDRVGHGLFNATSAACDIVIAIAMSYYLPKLDSGVRASTHARIRRIIRLVVGTGSLTAAVAIIDQILFEAFPGTGYFLTPAFVIGKLYSNSMMVIFNSRVEFGSQGEETGVNLSNNSQIGRYPQRNVYHISSGGDETLRGVESEIRSGKKDFIELGHR
ncbi:hypothetical protein D9756_009262 [Leucocoprinus leucothites]|uniref:DUF6534 domain-containing protein n=1 Tax=Leucocoprinus leucothites TaxID=201217 RepID=A0A8H5FUY2_9AGAR|nr:hypothetical protein D9756_009262 [Leucoagaricus leucothites]